MKIRIGVLLGILLAAIATLASTFRPTPVARGRHLETRYFWIIGDSKSTYNYLDFAVQGHLNIRTSNSIQWLAAPRFSNAGRSTRVTSLDITNEIAARTMYNLSLILINLGANDVIGDANDIGNGTNWMSWLGVICDRLHDQWPNAQIYHMRFWRGDNTNYWPKMYQLDDTNLPAVLATRSWSHLGPDERTFIPRSDNGAYLFPDGLHPSGQAGQDETALRWGQAIFP